MTDTYEDLAERAEAMAAEHRRIPSLDLVRAALNEAGIRKARSAMRDAPDVLANAQETLRTCAAVEAAAKEAHDAALAEAAWELDAKFVVDKNKTYLKTPCPEAPHIFDDEERTRRFAMNEACPLCGDLDYQTIPMTADQRRAWVGAEAAKQPAVAKAAAALRDAVAETLAARDSVEVARLRCSIARHECDAAVAELEALTTAIPRSGT